MILDDAVNKYYCNDFTWSETGRLPASTFKIPNSIIAFETGVVESDSTLFPWNGERRGMEQWEQDLTFRDAFKYSCVPCYQEVAREVGMDRMITSLERLNYKSMQVDSSIIDNFWLVGSSKIPQFQQIEFLKELYQSELPIAKRTTNLVKSMMIIERNEKYTLSGKTG